MKKRHGAEQIVGKLREAEALMASGAGIAEVCQNRFEKMRETRTEGSGAGPAGAASGM